MNTPPLLPDPGTPVPAGEGLWRPHLPDGPVVVALVYWGDAPPFELQLLAQVFDEGIRQSGSPAFNWHWLHVDDDTAPTTPASMSVWVIAQHVPQGAASSAAMRLIDSGRAAVMVGPAAVWFSGMAQSQNTRIAMRRDDAAISERRTVGVVASSSIIEVDPRWTTCCGGFATVDLGLLMLQQWLGSSVVLQVMDALSLDRLRDAATPQSQAAAGVLGPLAPPLANAIALMEANIEEPLQTDDVARLVGASRRKLERLFKQHLGTMPARYYLDVRLRHARKLLRQTRHSLLQVGLMCGFSSGSHFSSSYSAAFGLTPRQERQQVLSRFAQ